MKLKVKDMDIATGGPLIAILNEKDARLLDLHVGDRLRLFYKNKSIVTIVDIAESEHAVPQGFIGLFEEVLKALGTGDYRMVKVQLEERPVSVGYIKEKLLGKALSKPKIEAIIKDIVNNNLTSIELTYFVSACFTRGLSQKETIALTNAMIRQGERLRLKRPVFDKHCIGGVVGNRTTMIIVPIVAAAGLRIPKTSSRSITSPAGTADTMEVLCNVTLPVSRMEEIIKEANGCIVWGGGMKLAAADDKLIEVRHPLSLDPEGMLLASVMAKKGSVKASHVLIDIPYGRGAKITNKKTALELSKKFTRIGKLLGMKVKVIITDGSEPIGNGIGPMLEAIDVIKVLSNQKDAPIDLREKGLMMAGHILELSGKYKKGKGKKEAKKILESGKALEKMKQIIRLQGPNIDISQLRPAKHKIDIKADKSGYIRHIDNKHIAKVARVAGAPADIYAGIYIHKKKGQTVKKGERIFSIYSSSREKLKFAASVFRQIDGVIIR